MRKREKASANNIGTGWARMRIQLGVRYLGPGSSEKRSTGVRFLCIAGLAEIDDTGHSRKTRSKKDYLLGVHKGQE